MRSLSRMAIILQPGLITELSPAPGPTQNWLFFVIFKIFLLFLKNCYIFVASS